MHFNEILSLSYLNYYLYNFYDRMLGLYPQNFSVAPVSLIIAANLDKNSIKIIVIFLSSCEIHKGKINVCYSYKQGKYKNIRVMKLLGYSVNEFELNIHMLLIRCKQSHYITVVFT